MVRQSLKGDQLPLFAEQIVPGSFAIVKDCSSGIATLGITKIRCEVLDVEGTYAMLLFPDGAKLWFPISYLEADTQAVEIVREQENDVCSLTNGDSAEKEQASNLGSGTVEIKTIKGRQYRYLRFRQEGKLRSKYLGKV